MPDILVESNKSLRVCFSTSCLAICKHGCRIAIKSRVDQFTNARTMEHFDLLRFLVEYVIEPESLRLPSVFRKHTYFMFNWQCCLSMESKQNSSPLDDSIGFMGRTLSATFTLSDCYSTLPPSPPSKKLCLDTFESTVILV